MPRVIRVHEYILKPEVDEQRFESAILEAKKRGLPLTKGFSKLS